MKVVERTDAELSGLLPFPSADSNKYTRGVLFAIGGSSRYPGAICMATKAAYMVGSGYVQAMVSPEALPLVRAFDPEVVAEELDAWDLGTSRLAVRKEGHPCALLVGSGLSPDDEDAKRAFLEALASCMHPIVVDGGAITWLSSEEGRSLALSCAERGVQVMVTPHMGEAARLARGAGVQEPPEEGASDEELASYSQALSDAYHAVIALKGPDTFITSPNGAPSDDSGAHDNGSLDGEAEDTAFIMRSGTAALAKAGTGDVLAGMVSGLVSQGLEPGDAMVLGTTLHARAGVEAARDMTEISVGAPDVITHIPHAIRWIAEGA